MSFETYTQNISAGKILKFALLPDFKSRFRDLGISLSWFVAFFAGFFYEAGLIEKNHPCLLSENLGKYGFRDVIGIAYRNIKWDRRHIPQILLFTAVIVSMAVSVVFIITAIFYYLTNYAHAQTTGSGMFTLPNGNTKETEYALNFLARVFGDTGIGAFALPANAGYSWLTLALQRMLAFYSNTLLYIAGFIVLYYIVMLVVEAAHSGKPLGGRYSSWAPVRLALAIALLVPFASSGYNGAQLVVFQSVAWGSNLATNIWYTALQAYDRDDYIGKLKAANHGEFIRGVYLINVCRYAYNLEVSKMPVNEDELISERSDRDGNSNVEIHNFGPKKKQDFCGSYSLPLESSPGSSVGANLMPPRVMNMNDATIIIERAYYAAGAAAVASTRSVADTTARVLLPGQPENIDTLYDSIPDGTILGWLTDFQGSMTSPMQEAAERQNELASILIPMGTQGGWANAGAFYLTLSRMNGGLQSALSNGPSIMKLPELLASPNASPDDEKKKVGEDPEPYLMNVHVILKKAAGWWENAPKVDGTSVRVESYGMGHMQSAGADSSQGHDGAVDANSMFNYFGSSVAEALKIDNTYNPLAELASMGSWISIVGMICLILGALLSTPVPGLGFLLMGLASTLIACGAALSIVLPMLPFFYFTFGVINWVIGVFQAVVGAPLWALSFLKIDGPGLTGSNAIKGVYLIFMLFLHPTLMIFGLLGSILVFTAAVEFFNTTFRILMSMILEDRNLISAGLSGMIYMVIYVVIVYMIGQSVFKMIDAIPKKMTRFLGLGGVETFNEIKGESGTLESHTIAAVGVLSSMARDYSSNKKEKPDKPDGGGKKPGAGKGG